MIKLINIDLDNTLLYEHYHISKQNMEAIDYAMSKGVFVGMNTGRNAISSRFYNKKIGFNAPLICANGTIIMDAKDKVLYQSVLDKEYFIRAIEISKKTGVPFHVYGPFNYYLVGENYQDDLVNTWDKRAKANIRIGMEYIKDYDEFLQKKSPLTKISFSTLNNDEFEVIKNECSKFTDWQITYALSHIVEINNRFDNKGTGMARLCDMLGISLKETACIGDDTNDFDMFKYGGVKVAMGNAVYKLKQMADIITDTCENDGVAKAIYKLV